MTLADGIAITSEIGQRLTIELERWRFALERRRMKIKKKT